jgi:hypothetical protein
LFAVLAERDNFGCRAFTSSATDADWQTEVLGPFHNLLVVKVVFVGVKMPTCARRQTLAHANVVHITLNAVNDLGKSPQHVARENARDAPYSDYEIAHCSLLIWQARFIGMLGDGLRRARRG